MPVYLRLIILVLSLVFFQINFALAENIFDSNSITKDIEKSLLFDKQAKEQFDIYANEAPASKEAVKSIIVGTKEKPEDTKKSKKVEEEKQIQIKKEEKITKERQEFRERSKRLNSRAETQVFLIGYTEEKWLAKLKKDFERPPYSEFDEKTKQLIWDALKDGWKDYNKKIKDDYLDVHQGDLLDLENLFKFKK